MITLFHVCVCVPPPNNFVLREVCVLSREITRSIISRNSYYYLKIVFATVRIVGHVGYG
jgi:hypothetical protein